MKSITIKEFDKLDSSELEQTMRIYSTSFPLVETKPIDQISTMLKNDKNYHLYVALENSSVVGFSLLYVLKNLEIGLLDYMAVVPKQQSKGIGTTIFNHSVEKLSSYIHNPIGMLLEIQKENSVDPIDSGKRAMRIKFYARLGVKMLNGVRYLIPPQYGNEPEETYLMILPLQKIESLSKSLVLEYASAIHKNVYHYKSNDLLNRIAKTMPETIRFLDLQSKN